MLRIERTDEAVELAAEYLSELEDALSKRSNIKGPYVVVIDTDPYPSTEHGGTWWEVGVPEVSDRPSVNAAYEGYVKGKKTQRAD